MLAVYMRLLEVSHRKCILYSGSAAILLSGIMQSNKRVHNLHLHSMNIVWVCECIVVVCTADGKAFSILCVGIKHSSEIFPLLTVLLWYHDDNNGDTDYCFKSCCTETNGFPQINVEWLWIFRCRKQRLNCFLRPQQRAIITQK